MLPNIMHTLGCLDWLQLLKDSWQRLLSCTGHPD